MRRLKDIMHEVESLPAERQAEVFDFIAFLKRKQTTQKSTASLSKRAEIEALAGALSDDPIVRPSQGVFEVREPLA